MQLQPCCSIYIPFMDEAAFQVRIKAGGRRVSNDRDHQSQSGSVLLLVVGVLSIAMLGGVLALENYLQQAVTTRTGGAHVESNAYFDSLQQALSNQQVCQANIANLVGGSSIAYNPLSPSAMPQPNTLTFNKIMTTGNNSATLAGLGTGSAQNVLSNLVTTQKPYIDLTKNFQYFGVQDPNGSLPLGFGGNQCFSATLHADVNLETQVPSRSDGGVQQQQQSTGPRRTIGSLTTGADFPITLAVGPDGTVQSCFVGMASNFCKLPNPPVITTWQPDTLCHDTWGGAYSNYQILWGVTGATTATMTCTAAPGVTSLNLTAPAPQSFTQAQYSLTSGFSNCTFTAYNSVGDSVSQSTGLNFTTGECDTSTISLQNVPACVNVGQNFQIGWTDNARDTNDAITVNFGSPPTQQTQVASLASGSSGNMTFVAPSAPTLAAPISATDNDSSGNSGYSATMQVKSIPAITQFQPSSTSFTAPIAPGAMFTLSWATTGADSVDISNVGTGVGASSPGTSIAVPSATTTYTLTAHGGCTSASDVSQSVTVSICSCIVGNQTGVSSLSTTDTCGNLNPSCPGFGTGVPASCGSSNGQSFSTAPSTELCGTGNTVSTGVTPSGSGWSWECSGTTGAPVGCSATQAAAASCGSSNAQSFSAAPTTGLCGTGSTVSTTVTQSGSTWSWACSGTSGAPLGCSATVTPASSCVPDDFGNICTGNDDWLCTTELTYCNGSDSFTHVCAPSGGSSTQAFDLCNDPAHNPPATTISVKSVNCRQCN